MALNFQIDVSNFGTLTGTWRVPPAAPPCTAAELAISLRALAGGEPQTSPATCQFFAGQIILSGGNAWDGTFSSINDIPIAGIVPEEGLSVLRGQFVGPGVPPANTVSIGENSPLFNRTVGALAGVTLNLAYNYPGIKSLFFLATELLGASLTSAAPTIQIRQLYINGSYDIVTWSWGFSNGLPYTVPTTPTQSGRLFADEGRVEIQSGSTVAGSGGDLTNIYSTATPTKTGVDLKGTYGSGSGAGISNVILSWNDSVTGLYTYVRVANTDFDDWTSIFFSFLLPGSVPTDTLITVSLESTAFPAIPAPAGIGTQFSGSVKLGVLKILTTSASGIYKIETDKTDDTIYINSPTDNTTAEVKIPYPHIVTGFIGG